MNKQNNEHFDKSAFANSKLQNMHVFADFMKNRIEEFVSNLEPEIIVRSKKKLKKSGYTEQEIDFYFTRLHRKSPEVIKTNLNGKDREMLQRITRLGDDFAKIYIKIQRQMVKAKSKKL